MARAGLSASRAHRPAPSAPGRSGLRLGPGPGPGAKDPPAKPTRRSELRVPPRLPPGLPRSRRRQQRRPQLEEKEKFVQRRRGRGRSGARCRAAGPHPHRSARGPARPCPHPLPHGEVALCIPQDPGPGCSEAPFPGEAALDSQRPLKMAILRRRTPLAFRPARRSAPAAPRGAGGSTRAPRLARAQRLDPRAADRPIDLGQVTAPLRASPSGSVKWG
ncbi:hypothetical protein K5549_006379 [Capra hircus]|nr:hypothetical protein K5549_006379 [Capra hircus]